ncbi:MAG: hypothetical protein HKM91_11150 [Altererythrobacter sp.]|nr:hypothetical protein [Altererythrobacter sp.]
MSDVTTYEVPEGPLKLAGPVVRPKPGTLPLRGDLAHIAMAGRYLAAHYVIPMQRHIGDEAAEMHLAGRDDSDVVSELAAGTALEVLDIAGEWAWVCLSPEGPSGYVRIAQLAPADT